LAANHENVLRIELIVKRKKLVIISHTEHVIHQGIAYGWGPTVSEIDQLATHWKEVIHVGCLHSKALPLSSIPYSSTNIKFVSIPRYGGQGVLAKLGILLKAPLTIITVLKVIKGASEVQLRLPTAMGLYLLPILSFLPRKYLLWIKYAGDWTGSNVPISFLIQRWWLIRNLARCKVTINGFWPNQPKHCISFENPCLLESDISDAKPTISSKQFKPPFNLIFVGRIEHGKGLQRIVDALQSIPVSFINKVDFVGDGNDFDFYRSQLDNINHSVYLHGFLTKNQIIPIFKKAHFLLLPSDSEGFPKVVAEGACFGCIPVVSDVSSISHYISPSNGFIWPIQSNVTYTKVLETALQSPEYELKDMAHKLSELSTSFTHQRYFTQLTINILKP
jgi:glycosyltransferase involved in cell wall biosynthesis